MQGKLTLKNVLWGSVAAILFCAAVFVPSPAHADNKILGEVDFAAKNKAAKDAGVWVDGQYVGYLKELKGSKKVLLLPGKHKVSVREAGYKEQHEEVELGPGQKYTMNVDLEKDPGAHYSTVTAQVKTAVNPDRAAVFLDGMYAGHAHEFGGAGRAMLVSPGKHKIQIKLPGYQTFETEIEVVANQKYEIKTDLVAAPQQSASAR